MQKTLNGRRARDDLMIRHCPDCGAKLKAFLHKDSDLDYEKCTNPNCSYRENFFQ